MEGGSTMETVVIREKMSRPFYSRPSELPPMRKKFLQSCRSRRVCEVSK